MTSSKLMRRLLMSIALSIACCISLASDVEDCDGDFDCSSLYCNCDELCHHYDDCCTATPTNGKNIDKRLRESCHVYEGHKTFLKYPKAVYMIDKCVHDWQDFTVRQRCENNTGLTLMDIVPVSDPGWSLVFLNKYCARCNRVIHWIPWTLLISTVTHVDLDEETSFTSTLMKEMKREATGYSFAPSTFEHFRSCYPIFRTLNIFPNITECSTGYLAPRLIYLHSETYIARNKDCLDIFLSSIDEKITPFYSSCFSLAVMQRRFTVEYAVDLALLPSIHEHDEEIKCRETDIFLSQKDGCQLLHCPQYYIAYQGHCVHVVSYRTGFVLDILFQINGIVDSEFPRQMNNVYKTIVQLMHSGHFYTAKKKSEYTVYEGKDGVTETNCSFLSLIIPVVGTPPPEADTIQHALSHTFRPFRIGHLVMTYVNNVSLSTCKSHDNVREPMTIIPFFLLLKKYKVPCAGVMLVKHVTKNGNDTDFSVTQPSLLYSLKLNKTFVKESAVIHIGSSHFICVDEYVKISEKTASSMSMICSIYSNLLGPGILLIFSLIK